MLIRFILVAEGGAEGELVPHLRRICVAAGADEALGSFPDLRLLAPGNRVEDKLDAVLALNPDVDLVFVRQELVLKLPVGWLEAHPLTATELGQEQLVLARQGVKLSVA